MLWSETLCPSKTYGHLQSLHSSEHNSLTHDHCWMSGCSNFTYCALALQPSDPSKQSTHLHVEFLLLLFRLTEPRTSAYKISLIGAILCVLQQYSNSVIYIYIYVVFIDWMSCCITTKYLLSVFTNPAQYSSRNRDIHVFLQILSLPLASLSAFRSLTVSKELANWLQSTGASLKSNYSCDGHFVVAHTLSELNLLHTRSPLSVPDTNSKSLLTTRISPTPWSGNLPQGFPTKISYAYLVSLFVLRVCPSQNTRASSSQHKSCPLILTDITSDMRIPKTKIDQLL